MGGRDGEGEAEEGPDSDAAFGPDVPAVGSNDLAGDEESKAGAGDMAGGVSAVELVKDAGEFGFGNAGALVGDADDNPAGLSGGGDGDGGARGGVLGGIADQLAENEL